MRYLIVIEETETGFSAYAPDVAGCVATGKTKREVKGRMKQAMEFHLEGLRLERQAIPRSHAHSDYLDVTVTA